MKLSSWAHAEFTRWSFRITALEQKVESMSKEIEDLIKTQTAVHNAAMAAADKIREQAKEIETLKANATDAAIPPITAALQETVTTLTAALGAPTPVV